MVTIEVQLKEGDEEPEQHLDEGEHIERRVVPLDQLYEKLQGMLLFLMTVHGVCQRFQNCPGRMARLWMPGQFASYFTVDDELH